jgi:acetylornithine deacetylase
MQWQLKAKGRLFHSGLPHRAINSIELASEAMRIIQDRFYDDFPPRPEEEALGFSTGSTMKPTQVACAPGSTNQICPECTLSGDIRLSPFYDVAKVMEAIESYVADLNEAIEDVPTRGAWSKFVLPPEVDAEVKRGSLELKWTTSMSDALLYEGVACSLTSEGHKALVQATREVLGCAKPYSASGSLPLVRSMSKAGFDLQITGFGLMSKYHALNECCEVSGMCKGYEIVLRTISLLEMTA